jgi:hypothetical protein
MHSIPERKEVQVNDLVLCKAGRWNERFTRVIQGLVRLGAGRPYPSPYTIFDQAKFIADLGSLRRELDVLCAEAVEGEVDLTVLSQLSGR